MRFNLLLILTMLSSALAQTPVARLVGDVRDQTGAAVPAASVEVRNVDTGGICRTTTDERGGYTVPNLSPGRYDAEVDAAGFRRIRQTGLELQVDQTARLDFNLEVGAVTESVEVTAQVPLVNTENAVKGDVVVNQEIVSMPLAGRDFFELGLLVPNVAEKREGSWQGSAMAVNGARPDNTNFVVDGFNNQNQRAGQAQMRPPIEAMQEFKVETSGYSAEFGRLAGGVVNMALKTGANRFHGALFEFLRNDTFDARNFFGADTSRLRRHQFGATLSGPVRVPRLYNGLNRTFFVFSWESLREEEGELNLVRVPTDLERAGNFSQTLDSNGRAAGLKDPLSSAACNAPGGAGCFPGNIIPASRFHPGAAALRNYYPSPNLSGGAYNYRASALRNTRWDSFLYKIDHRLTAADALSFRYTHRRNDNHLPFDGSDLGTFAGRAMPGNMLAGISYTRTFSPVVINELRAGFSRMQDRSDATYIGRNVAGELGIPGTTSDPKLVGFPAFKIRDMPGLGDDVQAPNRVTVNIMELADTVTWVRSAHTIKFGGALLRGQVFHIDNRNVRGTFNFQGRWTNVPFGDFLLGMLNGATRAASPVPIYVFNTDVGSFIQDDYRVRPNLTLNLGLRYEYSAPLKEKYGRMAGFVPEIGKLVVADDRAVHNLDGKIRAAGLQGRVALAREAGIPQDLAYPNRRNFAPRFGFAWRPRGNNNVAVRGGYGVYYAATANNPIRLDLGNVFPFAATETYNRDTRQPNLLTLSTPFPESIARITGVNDVNGTQLRPASQYLQSWNLTLEKQVGGVTAVEIGYAGSKGTHLGQQININTPERELALMRPDGTFPRPFEQFNNIRLYMFDSNSSYNAGLLTLRRRFASGFFYRISYTLSKSLDSASQISSQDRGGGANLDPRNRRLDRGRSNWDTRHGFTTTFSYRIPARFGNWLGGWQAAGTGRMASGRPFTPSSSNAQEDLGEGNRPDRIAFGTLRDPTPERWFDTSAFPLVPLNSYRFGNSGRNILDGPGMVVFNLALMRNFPLRELGTLQLRLEAFNATNHTNFRLPDRNVNTVTGAVIDSAGPARIFQAGLRFEF